MTIRSALLRDIVLVWLTVTQLGCAQSLRQTVLVGTVQGNKKAGTEGIEIVRGGAQVNAREKMALEVGDELRTGPVSRAVILFPDKTWVIVEPNTIVGISSLRLMIGTILANAKRLFQVETQFVRVTVEGTEYRVRVDENSQASVDVAEGTTRLTSNTGSWEPVAVLERESALVKSRAVPQKRPLSPEEVLRIRQQLRTFEAIFYYDFINFGINMQLPGPPMQPPRPPMPPPGPAPGLR